MGVNRVRAWVVLLAWVLVGWATTCRVSAQSGLYIPSARPIKDMQKALVNPEVFCMLLQYEADEEQYSIQSLDLLDSAYNIAFAQNNPNYYTMTIEAYVDADDDLGQSRIEAVYRYFCMRTHTRFPVRKILNPIHCSCHGDTTELLRYEVPVTKETYNIAQLPEARRVLNKTIQLDNTVLVTFRNDPDQCVGTARGCAVPQADSVIHGYYASLFVSAGAIYSVGGTKDTCPDSLNITVDDHLDYKTLVEQYRLVPHRKQLIVSAGYIVLGGKARRGFGECQEAQRDSIFVRIPATQEQLDAKLKFWAKVKTSRGIEYRALPTRKMPGKGQLVLQAPVNVTQLDTIYLGKRIEEKELSKYFYEVDSPTQAAAFAVGSRFFVAYSVDKKGQYELKKPLKSLFRIIPDQEEEIEPSANKASNPEEIIE